MVKNVGHYHQRSCLSVGIEPRSINQLNEFEYNRGRFVETNDYYERLQAVQSTLVCKELNIIPVGKIFIDGMIKLSDFVKWAANIGYNIPAELHGLLNKNQSGQIKAPDMVRDSPDTEKESETSQPQNNDIIDFDKILDGRERMSLYKIISALCEMLRVAPFDAGLAEKIKLIIEKRLFIGRKNHTKIP